MALYLKAAGGNWSAAATWSATGAAGVDSAGPPTAATDVIFELASGNCTIDAASACRSLDTTSGTGTYGGVLTHNAFTLSIGDGTAGAGNVALKLNSGMTYSPADATRAISFVSTSATQQTVEYGGKSVGNQTFGLTSGLGSWIISSNTNVNADATATLNHVAGILDMNGKTYTLSRFISAGSLTRTLTLGASTITTTSATNSWNMGTITGLTITANTANITLSASGAAWAMGNIDYNGASMNLTGAGSPAISSIGASSKIGNFNRTGTNAKTDGLSLAGDFIIASGGTFTFAGGTTTNRMLVFSSVMGTQRTITNTGVTMAWSNVDIQDLALTTAYDASGISEGSGDCGGNTNITFTPAAPQYWFKDTGNWSNAALWFLGSGGTGGAGRVPLPQDNVFFDSASFSAGSKVVTGDMIRLGKNIVWTGALNTPQWTINNATNVNGSSSVYFGSVTTITGMNFSMGGGVTHSMQNRVPATLASGGHTWNTFRCDNVGTSVTLDDAFASAGQLNLVLPLGGSFLAGTFNVTVNTFASNNSNTRTINMGSGTWTVTRATATAAEWIIGATGCTLIPGASTLVFSGTDNNNKGISFGDSLSYNNVSITAGGTGVIAIDGSNANFNLFTALGPKTITWLNGQNFRFHVSPVFLGTAGNLVNMSSATTATCGWVLTGGGFVSMDYCVFAHIVATPATNTWFGGKNSTNNQGVATAGSGIIFDVPYEQASSLLTDGVSGNQGVFSI